MFDLASQVIKGSSSNLKMPIMCIHGIGGVGKSTFGASAPNNLFIPIEDGLGMLAANPNVTMTPVPQSYAEVDHIIDALLTQQHSYKWLVIDSITSLEKKLWQDLCKKYNHESIEAFGYGKGFNMALEIMSKFILKLRQLRDLKGMGVIIIAHSNVTTVNKPDKDPYDLYGIQVNKKLADFIHSQCDLVGFAEKEVCIRTEDNGFSQRGKAIETGQRLLHCYSTEKYSSKNRYGMEDMRPIPLDFNALMQAIASKIPQQPKSVQE
ncbi:ATP-binding protein [Bowmanella sp. JS7-9]|uniref:ATP-binding protein n=1 Tax=Pseudobowmanella zhangzhouensis TaxID=1537679 RepID=A0ABW1XQP0_9ALTE|nr:ATP-binding protein [Bowmanella sp. JS7-9]TBX21948.1 hypothetical protein TK45_10710 [Bowmanella sp. JS7-9]